MERQLREIMGYYKLVPAALADRIGVQRSSISHIMSGRNKPSYDFIIKLLSAFEDLNSEWLLFGTGSMLKAGKEGSSIEQSTIFESLNSSNSERDKNVPLSSSIMEQISDHKGQQAPMQKDNLQVTNVNKVLKVMVFYEGNKVEIFEP